MISCHSGQTSQVNNCEQKVGQPGKELCSTAGSDVWFAVQLKSFCIKLGMQYGGQVKSGLHTFVSCLFYMSCFRQDWVTQGPSDHCSVGWLPLKLGVSAIMPQIATGYSILSKYHFLCASCPSLFAFSLSKVRQTCSRCAVLLIISSMEYFVCVKGMIFFFFFAALEPVQMCQVALVCLFSWLQQLSSIVTI